MATLRNKRKLSTLNNGNNEEHPSSNQARDTNVPRSQEDYITQVSEEHENYSNKEVIQGVQ